MTGGLRGGGTPTQCSSFPTVASELPGPSRLSIARKAVPAPPVATSQASRSESTACVRAGGCTLRGVPSQGAVDQFWNTAQMANRTSGSTNSAGSQSGTGTVSRSAGGSMLLARRVLPPWCRFSDIVVSFMLLEQHVLTVVDSTKGQTVEGAASSVGTWTRNLETSLRRSRKVHEGVVGCRRTSM